MSSGPFTFAANGPPGSASAKKSDRANTTADAPELAPLRGAHDDTYAQAHAGGDLGGPQHVTLNPLYNPPARIDLVFAQRGAFTVEAAERILDQPAADGTWASDHYGLHARLDLVATP